MWSLVLIYTGRDSKKVFVILKESSDFENDFLSLTDIAKYKSDDANATICNWMRNRETIEFLGLWESLHNQDFKPLEYKYGSRKSRLL